MDQQEQADRLRAAKDVAREAGRAAMGYFRNPDALEVVAKGRQDFVSQADHAVEALIRERLRGLFPGDGFLGEEGGGADNKDASGIWVVDPIDGTTNFINRVPVWCVSIAYLRQGHIEVGVVYDPNADEIFAARRGHGAFCGETPISTSAADSLTQGTVGVGYSTRTSGAAAVDSIRRLLAAGGIYQCNGSSALTLAYVGAGRLLGFLEAPSQRLGLPGRDTAGQGGRRLDQRRSRQRRLAARQPHHRRGAGGRGRRARRRRLRRGGIVQAACTEGAIRRLGACPSNTLAGECRPSTSLGCTSLRSGRTFDETTVVGLLW